jgi:rhodanese-related sulfurtransferase
LAEHTTDSRRSGLVGIVLKALVLVLIGAGAGISYNHFSDAGIPLETPARVEVQDRVSWNLHIEGLRITLDEAKRLQDEGEALFIDARVPRAYAAGHIAGAINMPAPAHDDAIRKLLGDVDKDRLIVTYCSGGSCQNSYGLARQLVKTHGFRNAKAFYEGWNAWFWAKYPMEKGEGP